MPTVSEEFLLDLLRACAAAAPQPLYPARFAREANLDRDLLDEGLDELRRRGLIQLTEWVRDFGQGCALTEAGKQALASNRPLPRATASSPTSASAGGDYLPYQRGEIVREAVFNPRPPYVARTLLILNLLYFAYGAFFAWRHDLNVSDYIQGRSPPPQFTTHRVILELGAIRALWVVYPVSLDDEPARRRFERIILACFLHIGLLHLFMNMYGLYSLGPLIEAMWGPIRFLTIYAIAGIVSGCLVVLIYVFQASDLPVPQMIETLGHAPVVAGASGCLFGIFAALCVWFLLNRQHLPDRLIEAWSRNITMNLVLLLAINFIPGVSWQGHLGGAIGGLLAALLLHVNRFSPHRSLRILALLGVPAIPIAFFAMLFYESQQFIALVGG